MINIILDNSILIDKNFGTRNQKKNFTSKLEDIDYCLYISSITLGEFIRTALHTAIKLINYIINRFGEIESYPSFYHFLDDVSIDLPSYSLHEKDRVFKISKLLKKRFGFFYDSYRNSDIPFRIAIDSIIDDIINFKEQFLNGIITLPESYHCKDSNNSISYNSFSQELNFSNKITCEIDLCKINSLRYFYKKYLKEIMLINKAIELKKIKFEQKFKEALKILMAINEVDTLDGRKHYCYNLTDFFVILEAPSDYKIFTTNIKHFLPIAEILHKKLL